MILHIKFFTAPIQRRLRWGLVLLFWCVSFTCLFRFGPTLPTGGHLSSTASDAMFESAREGIKDFHYIRRDPANGQRPLYSIQAKDLSVKTGKLLFFSTGLYDIARFEELKLKIFTYPSSSSVPGTSLSVPEQLLQSLFVGGELSSEDRRSYAAEMIGGVFDQEGQAFRLHCPDLRNVSEMVTGDFEYELYEDNDLRLSIRSHRAIASHDQPSITLRGLASVEGSNGTRLESNCIEWDVKERCFRVEGTYILTKDSIRTAGRGICIDEELNPVTVLHAQLTR